MNELPDFVIALSCCLLALSLAALAIRRKDLAFRWIFLVFALFLVATGATHALAAYPVARSVAQIEAVLNLLTAIIALPAAVLLIRLVPRVMTLPYPEQLRAEIVERTHAAEQARKANSELELRSRERTADLTVVTRQLKERKIQRRIILDHYPGAIYIRNRGGDYDAVNREFEQVFGTAENQKADDDYKVLLCGPIETEEEVLIDGQLRTHRLLRFPLCDAGGGFYGVCGMSTDISERKALDRQLREANARMVELAAMLNLARVMVRSEGGRIEHWSRGATELYGFTVGEAVGRNSHELLQTIFPEPLENIEKRLRQYGTWNGELRHKCRNGRELWVASHWTLHPGDERSGASVTEVNNDISEMKAAEEKLRVLEATLAALVHDSDQAMVMVDNSGNTLRCNAMAETLFGYAREELIGISVNRLLVEGAQADPGVHLLSGDAARPPTAGEGLLLNARRKNGTEFPVEISLSHVQQNGEEITMALIADISAREHTRRARENSIATLNGALRQKTVLLSEVHHRVKNNMAIISGLLGMQAEGMEGSAAIGLLESQQRVLSMALIHEQLYGTEDLNGINLGEYVEQLAAGVRAVYETMVGQVEVNTAADPVLLGVDQAIPCGLILNEVLSNSFKYAFPNRRPGKLQVTIRLRGNQVTVSCQDDGVGFPEEFNSRNTTSMGMQIVRILVTQIRGTFSMERAYPGTRFEMTFALALP